MSAAAGHLGSPTYDSEAGERVRSSGLKVVRIAICRRRHNIKLQHGPLLSAKRRTLPNLLSSARRVLGNRRRSTGGGASQLDTGAPVLLHKLRYESLIASCCTYGCQYTQPAAYYKPPCNHGDACSSYQHRAFPYRPSGRSLRISRKWSLVSNALDIPDTPTPICLAHSRVAVPSPLSAERLV